MVFKGHSSTLRIPVMCHILSHPRDPSKSCELFSFKAKIIEHYSLLTNIGSRDDLPPTSENKFKVDDRRGFVRGRDTPPHTFPLHPESSSSFTLPCLHGPLSSTTDTSRPYPPRTLDSPISTPPPISHPIHPSDQPLDHHPSLPEPSPCPNSNAHSPPQASPHPSAHISPTPSLSISTTLHEPNHPALNCNKMTVRNCPQTTTRGHRNFSL